MPAFDTPGQTFAGVVVTLSVSASVGGCTTVLKNSNGDLFEATALDPRMQNLLETAMSKAWYANVTYVTQGSVNLVVGVTVDIRSSLTREEL